MPFSPVLEQYPAVRRALRARRNPVAAYGIAVALVAVATLIAWGLSPSVFRVPFITFFPAIVLGTLLGGLWPGVLATALSSFAAWHYFLPAGDTGEREALIVLFVSVSAINLAVVSLLNAAVQHVLAQEENLRILIESSPTGIVVVDDDGKIKLVNSSAERLFGYSQTELLGHRIEQLVPTDRATDHRAVCAAFFQKPEARPMGTGLDLSGRRKDGTEFPVEVALNPVRRNGTTGVLATVIDITDRVKARESERMVIRELRHRTQNLFAVFQAIARLSLDEGKTPTKAKSVLIGRIQALSESYNAFAEAGWEGALLAEVIRRQFAGFSERVAVRGCEIMVGPSAAQQFALVIHELATNALKYGALSTPAGQVMIEGKVEREDGIGVFSLFWKETGGPLVSKPTKKGFGTVILLDSVRHLARSVAMNFEPAGLSYELQVDLHAIEMPTKPAILAATAAQQAAS
jgi:PAS domain S-box-containing protein